MIKVLDVRVFNCLNLFHKVINYQVIYKDLETDSIEFLTGRAKKINIPDINAEFESVQELKKYMTETE